jgi:sterol desaturase/sphingolipid hydroxylase (fatty acid hydroxylase superfamily)
VQEMTSIDWLLAWKGWIVLGVFVALFVAERAFPAAPIFLGLRRVGRNIGLAVLNFAAGPLIVIPITALAAGSAVQWRPDFLLGMQGFVLDLLVLDLWIYWWHRINHRLPFLWRWHEVHHLDETLDVSSAIRFHVGEVLLSSLVRAGVIWLLAIPLTSVVVFEILIAAFSMFHHSNVFLPQWLEKPLSRLVVTPSIHWVHHHAVRRDTDSNYSTILSVWDRIFGSTSATIRTPSMLIGVEGLRDRPLPDLVVRPLQLHSARASERPQNMT